VGLQAAATKLRTRTAGNTILLNFIINLLDLDDLSIIGCGT
jgi:hypothetical protein